MNNVTIPNEILTTTEVQALIRRGQIGHRVSALVNGWAVIITANAIVREDGGWVEPDDFDGEYITAIDDYPVFSELARIWADRGERLHW